MPNPRHGPGAPLGHASAASTARTMPAWQSFLAQEQARSPAERDALHAQLQQHLQERGVHYSTYTATSTDNAALQRPWPQALYPLILEAPDWLELETGIQQRMRLLEAMLDDLYGPQKLLAQGLLPPALVVGHPAYLRALHGVPPVGATRLHLVAFDVVRSPQGHWQLLRQQTQAAAGLGYAMENRRASMQVHGPSLASLRVQTLDSTYQALHDRLRSLCPNPAQAHIALLTPGPYSANFFEHAALAQHWGFSLVQGRDLTVRGARLFLQSLDGLVPVHGLLSQVDEAYLDPLELQADSLLGVPGLLQAVRAGHLLLANHPGSAVADCPALLPFLPAIAQALLQEPLRLAAAPTGLQASGLPLSDAASAMGGAQTMAPAQPDCTSPSQVPGFRLRTWAPPANGASGGAKMPASPAQAAQSAPSAWCEQPIELRVFAVASQPLANGAATWRVLPAGLVRTGSGLAARPLLPPHSLSADVWVLPPHAPASALPHNSPKHNAPRDTQRATPPATMPNTPSDTPFNTRSDTPSDPRSNPHPNTPPSALARNLPLALPTVSRRAAENLYWLGRYQQRTHNATQLALCLLTHAQPPATSAFAQAQPQGMPTDPARNQALNLPPNSALDGALDPALDLALDPALHSALHSALHPALAPTLKLALDPWCTQMAIENGLLPASAPATDPHLPAPAPQAATRYTRELRQHLHAHGVANSLGFQWRALHLAAGQVREQLPNRQWECLAQAQALFFADGTSATASASTQPTTDAHAHTDAHADADAAIHRLHASTTALEQLQALQQDYLPNDKGWCLLRAGQHLERLLFLAHALTLEMQMQMEMQTQIPTPATPTAQAPQPTPANGLGPAPQLRAHSVVAALVQRLPMQLHPSTALATLATPSIPATAATTLMHHVAALAQLVAQLQPRPQAAGHTPQTPQMPQTRLHFNVPPAPALPEAPHQAAMPPPNQHVAMHAWHAWLALLTQHGLQLSLDLLAYYGEQGIRNVQGKEDAEGAQNAEGKHNTQGVQNPGA